MSHFFSVAFDPMNFCQIGPSTPQLAALERVKFTVTYHGENGGITFLGCLWSDLLILAGNKIVYNSTAGFTF